MSFVSWMRSLALLTEMGEDLQYKLYVKEEYKR